MRKPSKVVGRLTPMAPGVRLARAPRTLTLTGRLRDVPGMPSPAAIVRVLARVARRWRP
jgi:hypothetical protein